jgi:hypothetical protein
LDRASTQKVKVSYATVADTAQSPADFDAASGTVVFLPGQKRANVTVWVKADNVQEATERFFVTLSNPVRAILGNATGVGLIKNTGGQP